MSAGRRRLHLVARVIALALVAGMWSARSVAAQTEVVEYYGQDALGSIRIVFNASGAAIARADYEPFGELFAVPGMPGTSGLPAKQFTGQERDAEASFDYFGARFFVPRTGRFSQVDPVFAGLFDPQRWNRYAYVRNNPLSLVDPDGRNAAACMPGPFLFGFGFVWNCFDSVTVGGGGGGGIGGVPTQIVFPPWGGGGSIDTGGGNRQGVDLTPTTPTSPKTPTTTLVLVVSAPTPQTTTPTSPPPHVPTPPVLTGQPTSTQQEVFNAAFLDFYSRLGGDQCGRAFGGTMTARDAMLATSWGITPLPENPNAMAVTMHLTPPRVYFNALNPIFFASGTIHMPGAGSLPSGVARSLGIGHETGHLVGVFGPDQGAQNALNTRFVWRNCY